MKQTDKQQAGQRSANMPQETTVTQITPDDILADGGPLTPAQGDETPTERQLEEDTVTVNPSVDSMESRG